MLCPNNVKSVIFYLPATESAPKNRFVETATGKPGLNYLCAGYHRFFKHAAPYMDFMKHELDNQRPPANVMQWVKQNIPDK